MYRSQLNTLTIALVLALGACKTGDQTEISPEPPTTTMAASATPSAMTGTSAQPTTPTAMTGSTGVAPSAPGGEAPPATLTGAGYELALTADDLSAGQVGNLHVAVKAIDGYHMNDAYPISVQVSGDQLSFARTEFAKEHAANFTETGARFDVPVTPEGEGERRITASVDFAVCTETTCVPAQKTISLALPVAAAAG